MARRFLAIASTAVLGFAMSINSVEVFAQGNSGGYRPPASRGGKQFKQPRLNTPRRAPEGPSSRHSRGVYQGQRSPNKQPAPTRPSTPSNKNQLSFRSKSSKPPGPTDQVAPLSFIPPDAATSGSGSPTAANPNLPPAGDPLALPSPEMKTTYALEGHCPVSLRNLGRWVQGDWKVATMHEDELYAFASQEQKEEFLADPAKYVPALNGDCIVTYVDTGLQVPGNVRFTIDYENRIYLFADEKQKERFRAAPQNYRTAAVSGAESRVAARPIVNGADAPLSMSGHCPVSLKQQKQWVPGSPDYSATFDGRTYRFRGPNEMQLFQAEPTSYAPVLRGDSAVTLASNGTRVAGNLHHTIYHRGRLFVFASEREMQTFKATPDAFADIDLAFGGKCPVSLVDLRREVSGKAEWTEVYEGMRYRFPSATERNTFLASPEKYKVGAANQPTTAARR